MIAEFESSQTAFKWVRGVYEDFFSLLVGPRCSNMASQFLLLRSHKSCYLWLLLLLAFVSLFLCLFLCLFLRFFLFSFFFSRGFCLFALFCFCLFCFVFVCLYYTRIIATSFSFFHDEQLLYLKTFLFC